MAAYAALISVMNIIDALELHPRPPISLHIKQVQLLTQKITFLQEFLEAYNPQIGYSTEADPLESRIADAAYAAEDVIESHIVDQITSHGKKMSFEAFYEAVERVIEDMSLIQKEAMEINQTLGVQHQLRTKSTPSDSLKSSPIAEESSMVGAEDVLLEMKDKLTSDRRDLQILPIVGMGGLGKTTAAINIYQDSLIKEHFDICAWATISQEYTISEMLIKFLRQLNQNVHQNLSEDELGEILYRHLFGRKYLIVMDDMWSIEAWDGVKRFLPDNKNGSRIVVTTRLSNLASKLPNSNSLEMKLLDEDESWELLSEIVFGEEDCPLELEETGKKIGKSCQGLPLSIVVVGGFLAKSKHTREFWESIEANLNSVVNLGDDGRCLKILNMSYKQLPIYLKPCFLYMGIFPEDDVIRISRLVKLWVADGFLKPVSGKSLEEIAKEYLKDLADRNLIMIDRIGSTGNIKFCKIHDLLRDFCLRQANKERFYTASSPHGIVNGQRRIVISKNEDINALSSMSLARSLMLNTDERELPLHHLRLLRILYSSKHQSTAEAEFLENVHHFVNSRFLSFLVRSSEHKFPSSIWLFWNLQTLIINHPWAEVIVSTDIWYMPYIRHVEVTRLSLPDPPNNQDDIGLRNLQTLKTIRNFKFSIEVVKRILTIKKLYISYDEGLEGDSYCLSNLDCLDKLESFACYIYPSAPDSLESLINFPHSLKKLTLQMDRSRCWEEILDKISALPLLQKLKLIDGRFREGEWETSEGQFRSLKFLSLDLCTGLQVWITESSHFPCLEHLRLFGMDELKEIPLDFAEISTLRVIDMTYCSDSAAVSAKKNIRGTRGTIRGRSSPSSQS